MKGSRRGSVSRTRTAQERETIVEGSETREGEFRQARTKGLPRRGEGDEGRLFSHFRTQFVKSSREHSYAGCTELPYNQWELNNDKMRNAS